MSHILEQLTLPDRFERLRDHLGDDVANLLVQPSSSNIASLRLLSEEIKTRQEGVLVPISGRTGIGKTTFAMNAAHWVPGAFARSLQYVGNLDFDSLSEAAQDIAKSLDADNKKIIPIVVDHRENNPPSDAELAAIKRFLRTNAAGVPVIIFWPETDEAIAKSLSERYVGIAGEAAIDLPLVCEGPSRESWIDIAKHTLYLANSITNLESLGVDPENYSPSNFHTLGDFLRRISRDFNKQIIEMRTSLEKEVSVAVVFVSESVDPGVLNQITSSSKYGLLDGHSLIAVTPQSVIGKWWDQRRGLLTRTIVQLNAMALCMPPSTAASCIRNLSDEMELFDKAGYRRYGPARAVRDLTRSDVGKLIIGTSLSRFESRGTPGDEGGAAFQLLAETGFNLGKDKKLNQLMASGIKLLLDENKVPYLKVSTEKKLDFCPLIPDNAIHKESLIQCFEYTWRKGDFLESGNRSTVAQYILTKLKNYARELGWTAD
jgi:hypothetical protein